MTESQIDHDRLFKELLENFFAEFMELFFPEAACSIDLTEIRFLQQEIFTDVTAGDRHEVDILVETRLKGQPGLILVHVEPQSYVQKNFNERMFVYFSRLYEKYRRKILPVAVFSYDRVRDEPDSFGIVFPFLEVLNFRFYKLELKRLDWREYIHSDNPVAATLISKMGFREDERVRVKLRAHGDGSSVSNKGPEDMGIDIYLARGGRVRYPPASLHRFSSKPAFRTRF